MTTIVDGLRTVLGVPQFYANGALDYGLVFEYFIGAVVLCVVVSSVMKIIGKVFCK